MNQKDATKRLSRLESQSVTISEVSQVANKANKDLKHVNFIGQFENVSKWIPRSCSVYPDPIIEEDLEMTEKPKVEVINPADERV